MTLNNAGLARWMYHPINQELFGVVSQPRVGYGDYCLPDAGRCFYTDDATRRVTDVDLCVLDLRDGGEARPKNRRAHFDMS
jgi:hypothetical protein